MTFQDWIPPVITNLFVPEKLAEGRYFFRYNQDSDTWKDIKYLESFECIPELNAVINMKANARSNGVFKVVDSNGKEYPNEPILELLKKPNWFQAEKEFIKQTCIFHSIYGNEYIYADFPVGFDWSRAKALFTLPPNLTHAEYIEKAPFFSFSEQPKGVTYIIKYDNGDKKELPKESIIHLNDNRIDIKKVNGKNILTGTSKQEALRGPLNNIRAAYESRGMILKYRGANGAWVNKSKTGDGAMLPMEKNEKKNLQERLEGYGTLQNQHQTFITNQELAWVQAGTNNPMNLGLFEETEQDFNKILDAHGVKSELFVRGKDVTFENQKQARKGMYSETIIPESNEWCSALSQRFYPDGKKSLIMGFMHLAIFQEDMKSRAEVITLMVNSLSKALQDGVVSPDTYIKELERLGIKQN